MRAIDPRAAAARLADAPTAGIRPAHVRSLLSAARPVHWIKNGFVLAPVLFSYHVLTLSAVMAAAAAAAAFCFASSAVYVFNDLVDRERDRVHPQKRHRPIASGAVGTSAAAAVMAACLCAAAGVCLLLPLNVGLLIGGYVALNIVYTAVLNQLVLLDVMAIAAGFMLRIVAGGEAAGIALSPWMLLTGFFLSLFLGFTKRMSERLTVAPNGRRAVLRSYSRGFLMLMVGMFVSLTIITYSLYAFFPRVNAPQAGNALVYTVPLVVYGLLRYLYLAVQHRAGGDVADAIRRDVPLVVCIALWVAAAAALVGLRL